MMAVSGTAMSAPKMPATSAPIAMTMTTASGMDADQPAHQERLQDVALDLLYRDHTRRA